MLFYFNTGATLEVFQDGVNASSKNYHGRNIGVDFEKSALWKSNMKKGDSYYDFLTCGEARKAMDYLYCAIKAGKKVVIVSASDAMLDTKQYLQLRAIGEFLKLQLGELESIPVNSILNN